MKAYTDLGQSKKLAEILPLESADLWWAERYTGTVKENGEYIVNETPFYYRSLVQPSATNCSQDTINDIPCWSLAALLGVLPTTIGNFFEKTALRLRMDKGENDFNIWYENFDCGDVAEGLDVKEDNPVDACYEAIIHLHEQKLL